MVCCSFSYKINVLFAFLDNIFFPLDWKKYQVYFSFMTGSDCTLIKERPCQERYTTCVCLNSARSVSRSKQTVKYDVCSLIIGE
jgi:hypothetical protein